MPKNVAQWTGLAVTSIIVFGCDPDVLYALPLGIMAGATASLVVALDDRVRAFREARIRPAVLREPSVSSP
ncbi:MAG: hypothetical protein JO056_08780 [Alphaproteobacteria bacterium]|nr:hypothetical protein [Alphaproteobacteria bacterium]